MIASWFVCISQEADGTVGRVYLQEGEFLRELLEIYGSTDVIMAGARLAVLRAVPFRTAATLLADGFLGPRL